MIFAYAMFGDVLVGFFFILELRGVLFVSLTGAESKEEKHQGMEMFSSPLKDQLGFTTDPITVIQMCRFVEGIKP